MAADMTGTQDLFVAKHIRWVQAVFCSFFFLPLCKVHVLV